MTSCKFLRLNLNKCHQPRQNQAKYFPLDIAKFVEKSSLQQLSNYIEQYSPVIMASNARYLAAIAQPEIDPPLADHRSTSDTSIRPENSLEQQMSPTQTPTAAIPSGDSDSAATNDTLYTRSVQTAPALPSRSTSPSVLHPALEEAQHRKHTRRRNPRAR